MVAKPFLKLVLKFGDHNPRWPPKYLKLHWLPYFGLYGSYLHDIGAFKVSSGRKSSF